MGTDIHMVLEKRILPPGLMPGNEQWVGVNAFPYVIGTVWDNTPEVDHRNVEGRVSWDARGRNYDLFAALAGVRGDGPRPRGMPDDVSLLAQHVVASWGEDGHSHTWMTMDEALPLFVMHGQFGRADKAVLDALRSGIEAALLPYMAHFWSMDDDDTLADYRLIICFDN